MGQLGSYTDTVSLDHLAKTHHHSLRTKQSLSEGSFDGQTPWMPSDQMGMPLASGSFVPEDVPDDVSGHTHKSALTSGIKAQAVLFQCPGLCTTQKQFSK